MKALQKKSYLEMAHNVKQHWKIVNIQITTRRVRCVNLLEEHCRIVSWPVKQANVDERLSHGHSGRLTFWIRSSGERNNIATNLLKNCVLFPWCNCGDIVGFSAAFVLEGYEDSKFFTQPFQSV